MENNNQNNTQNNSNATNNTDNNKDSNRRSNWHTYGRVYPGIWLIIIGGVFLLNNFGFIQGQAWGKLWPLFIIIPGVFMILPRRR
jgi:hypothetical protein